MFYVAMKGDDRGEIEREWAQGDGTRVGLEMHLPQMRLQVCFFFSFSFPFLLY
jgi:hypothetical protein